MGKSKKEDSEDEESKKKSIKKISIKSDKSAKKSKKKATSDKASKKKGKSSDSDASSDSTSKQKSSTKKRSHLPVKEKLSTEEKYRRRIEKHIESIDVATDKKLNDSKFCVTVEKFKFRYERDMKKYGFVDVSSHPELMKRRKAKACAVDSEITRLCNLGALKKN